MVKIFIRNQLKKLLKIAILPQTPEVADGLTVGELVSYGRFPHQKGSAVYLFEDKKRLIGL